MVAIGSVYSATPLQEQCDPKHVAALIATEMAVQWNHGRVRSWTAQGDFLSAPFENDTPRLKTALTKLESRCDVNFFDKGSFTARITPKTIEPPSQAASSSLISPIGTMVGLLNVSLTPSKTNPRDQLLLIYPARISAAVAAAKGTTDSQILNSLSKNTEFSAELDIEYNFNNIEINVFGGLANLSMRRTADLALRDLRSHGYAPMAQFEATVSNLDSLIPPNHHESFWTLKNSVLRLELDKQKNGQVRINIHESKQL